MFKSSKCNLQEDKQPKIVPPISFRSIFSLKRNTEPWKWQHGCNIEFMGDCTKIQSCLSEPISTKDLWCLIQSTCWLPLKTLCKHSYRKMFCFEGKQWMGPRRNFSTKLKFVEVFLHYTSTHHLPFTLLPHFYTHLKFYSTGVFCLNTIVTIVNNKWFHRAFSVGRCINSKCQVFVKLLFFSPDNNQHLC